MYFCSIKPQLDEQVDPSLRSKCELIKPSTEINISTLFKPDMSFSYFRSNALCVHVGLHYHQYVLFQAIFSIQTQNKEDIFLFAKVEKVLQGGISNCTEPYIKLNDPKMGSKVHRQMRQYCSHIGHYKMPFGWAAKYVFDFTHLFFYASDEVLM